MKKVIFDEDCSNSRANEFWQKLCLKVFGPSFPSFKNSYTKHGIETRSYSSGRMLEQLLCLLSNGKLIENNAHGMDFADGSDAKFRTVTQKTTSKYIQISGLRVKKGALRICAIDPTTYIQYFLYIPKKAYKSHLCIPVRDGKITGKYARYQVDSLETLANK